MKKSISLVLSVLMILAMLAAVGCGKGEKNDQAAPTQRADQNDAVKQTIDPNPGQSTGNLRTANKDTYVVKSADGFKEYGFTCFIAEADSEYTVKFDTDGDAVEWKVFVLDDKFHDSLRYLPQAHEPALTESGKLKVTKGQYVYVQCSVSSFSASEPYEGASVTFSGAGLPKN